MKIDAPISKEFLNPYFGTDKYAAVIWICVRELNEGETNVRKLVVIKALEMPQMTRI